MTNRCGFELPVIVRVAACVLAAFISVGPVRSDERFLAQEELSFLKWQRFDTLEGTREYDRLRGWFLRDIAQVQREKLHLVSFQWIIAGPTIEANEHRASEIPNCVVFGVKCTGEILRIRVAAGDLSLNVRGVFIVENGGAPSGFMIIDRRFLRRNGQWSELE